MKITLLICGSLSVLLSGCGLMQALGLSSSTGNELITSEQNMKLEAMCIEATKNNDRANKKYKGTLASAQGIFSFGDMYGVGKQKDAMDYDDQKELIINQSQLCGRKRFNRFCSGYNPFFSVYVNFETYKYVISYQIGKDDDYYLQFDEGQLVITEPRKVKAVFADTNVDRRRFKTPCYIITESQKKNKKK